MIDVKLPVDVSEEEFVQFRDMVSKGTEVFPATLKDLPERARFLAYYRKGGSLVGTGGIKIPRPEHRAKVFAGVRSSFDPNIFEHEIGWFHITDQDVEETIAKSILGGLLEKIGRGGIYMVLRSDNAMLVGLLKSMKFKKTGVEIPSNRGDYYLVVYARE